ncbi:MAG: PAS domain S-box protein [Methanoregula sp.]
MENSFLTNLQKRPHVLAGLIVVISVIVLVLNGYGLIFGMTNVLPHLFYIPVILMAYFFPRRGVFFSAVISAAYCSMVFFTDPVIPGQLLSAGGRVIMIILMAAVVSFLTNRLQESEQKFRGVAERSSDIIFLTDSEGKATYVSPSFGKILGMNPAEITGKQPEDFLHPDDLGLFHTAFADLAKGIPVNITARTRRKDGEYVSIEYLGAPVITNGSVTGLQIVGRDITQRRLVEDAHRETSRQLAEIIDVLPDPTFVVDKAGNVIAWNRAMERMSGIPKTEVLGLGGHAYKAWISGLSGPILIDYVLRRDTEGIKAVYPQVRFEANTVRSERDITRTDGTRLSLWISATPLMDLNGEVIGAIESLRDVTHQKKIQRALQESNKYLDTVINTLADPLFIKDRRYHYVTLNNSFCQYTGRTREELQGKSDYDFFRKEEADIFRKIDEEVFLTRQGNENEVRFTDPSGIIHTVSTKKALYINSAGEEFIVGIIRDITERKKTEQALQQALKKLNMLSSITRHDILNQLMGLRTYLELIQLREQDPMQGEYLRKGMVSVEAIQEQIEFTRYYEDIGVQVPQWHNAAAIFRSAASQLPLGDIVTDVQVSDLEVYADPLIAKVFYNLIENSLRHGERVTTLVLNAEETPEEVIVTYRDNGIGISVEDKKKLFSKGFGKHTGLGLFLSQEILSITGISITETGEPGAGVRFEIHIPKGAYRFTPH